MLALRWECGGSCSTPTASKPASSRTLLLSESSGEDRSLFTDHPCTLALPSQLVISGTRPFQVR